MTRLLKYPAINQQAYLINLTGLKEGTTTTIAGK